VAQTIGEDEHKVNIVREKREERIRSDRRRRQRTIWLYGIGLLLFGLFVKFFILHPSE
jgi:hypothetical protein